MKIKIATLLLFCVSLFCEEPFVYDRYQHDLDQKESPVSLSGTVLFIQSRKGEKFDPGLRVTGTFNLDKELIEANFSHYCGSGHYHHLKHEITINDYELALIKTYTPMGKLSIQPFWGLEYAHIHGQLVEDFGDWYSSYKIELLGPQAGLRVSQELFGGLSIHGAITESFLLSKYHHFSPYTFCHVSKLGAGIEWSFKDFSLGAGYERQYWGRGAAYFLQGITAEARFKF